MKLTTSARGRPRSLNAAAAEIAATVLTHVSFWLLALSMLDIRLNVYGIVAIAVLPVLLYLIAQIRGFGRLQPIFVTFLPLLAGLVGFRFFSDGVSELFNHFAKAINEVHPLSVFPTAAGFPETDLAGTAAHGVILLLAIIVSGLLAYAICRKVRPLAIALTVLPAFFGFAAGLRPTMPAFIFYLVAVTFYLILLTTRSKGTARRLTWLNGEISAALLVFLIILALLLGSYERSESIEHLREQIAQKIQTVRYAPDESADGMPGGDLTHADAVQYDGKTVLTVETPNAFSMYLRGFSGDVLKDGKWQPLDSSAYFDDYSLTGPWVRSRYFNPAISLGQLLDIKWEVQTTQYEEGQRERVTLSRYPVTVQNQLAYSNTVYAPYEVSADSKGLRRTDLSQEGLSAGGLKGQRKYELTVYRPLTNDYGSVSSDAIIGEDAEFHSVYNEEFVPTETVYQSFVRANEREIPEQYADEIEALWRSSIGTCKTQADAVYRIRTLFGQNFTYSLEASNTGGEDPLLTFLETREGYDAHFATLAVLLLRQGGYPARYAEGYYISDELAASVDPETDVVLEVPDSASHAWVELYKDGVGWVPVEVTPGYYETENGTATGTTAKEETVQPAETPEPENGMEDAGEDGSGPSEETESEQEHSRRPVWAVLLLPLLLALLLIPLIWNRSVRARIAAAESPATVALAYKYLMRVLRGYGLKPEERDPKRVARLLGDDEKPFEEAMDLMYKETFSQDGLSPDERAAFCDYILDLTGDRKRLRSAAKQLRAEQKTGNHKNSKEANHGK